MSPSSQSAARVAILRPMPFSAKMGRRDCGRPHLACPFYLTCPIPVPISLFEAAIVFQSFMHLHVISICRQCNTFHSCLDSMSHQIDDVNLGFLQQESDRMRQFPVELFHASFPVRPSPPKRRVRSRCRRVRVPSRRPLFGAVAAVFKAEKRICASRSREPFNQRWLSA